MSFKGSLNFADAIYNMHETHFKLFQRRLGELSENRATKILQILKRRLSLHEWTKKRSDPFETLVVTIISQNTADRNTVRAFETLSKMFEITPKALAKAPLSQIEDAVKTAGLCKAKAKTIQHAARCIQREYDGSLQPILKLPTEEARKALMLFPGIGPKTADVVLLFSTGKPTIPIDTHVNRVSKRLGLTPETGKYEAIRSRLQTLYNPADLFGSSFALHSPWKKNV